MAILSAQTIRERCALKPLGWGGEWPSPIISPFYERGSEFGLTFGLSACGYDVRIAENLTMWPMRFVLASTIEHFKMPNDVCARVLDKSSWARQGICVQNTFIEPGWEGYLTLEITNHRWGFKSIKAGMPIAQIVFETLDKVTETPYRGKYQHQARGAQPARLVDKT